MYNSYADSYALENTVDGDIFYKVAISFTKRGAMRIAKIMEKKLLPQSMPVAIDDEIKVTPTYEHCPSHEVMF